MRMTPDAVLSLGIGPAVMAIDIGGTDLKAALVDSAGHLLGLRREPTPHDGPDTAQAVLRRVKELAGEFARDYPLVAPVAAGLIAPGLVDDERGIAIQAVNLDWKDVPFRLLAEDLLSIPCAFSHDARAAGEAEFQLGAARHFRDVVVVVIGTGIAASIFIDGRVHSAGGYAGELGHSILDTTGQLCACGARGCLETVASAGAMVRRYRSETGVALTGADEVIEKAEAGDEIARRIWTDTLDALALSIVQFTAVLAPEAVVIGGGLAQAGDRLFVPLRERLHVLFSFHRRPLIVPALLGENAGLLGAALRARARLDAVEGLRPQPKNAQP